MGLPETRVECWHEADIGDSGRVLVVEAVPEKEKVKAHKNRRAGQTVVLVNG